MGVRARVEHRWGKNRWTTSGRIITRDNLLHHHSLSLFFFFIQLTFKERAAVQRLKQQGRGNNHEKRVKFCRAGNELKRLMDKRVNRRSLTFRQGKYSLILVEHDAFAGCGTNYLANSWYSLFKIYQFTNPASWRSDRRDNSCFQLQINGRDDNWKYAGSVETFIDMEVWKIYSNNEIIRVLCM